MSTIPGYGVPCASFDNFEVALDVPARTLWCHMKPQGRPSFTPGLLRDMLAAQDLIRTMTQPRDASPRAFDYLVLGSLAPGVFNLGGDLTVFADKIRQRDRDGLRAYAYACVRLASGNHSSYGGDIITVALLQGDALGGGFESAMSCDLLVAERQAKLGLPEVLFNLFPGMGAFSFLSRRVGARKAQEIILSGKTYSADEMHALGVVDIVAGEGGGDQAVREHIAGTKARRNAHAAVNKVRRQSNPATFDELRGVVDIWVDAALSLTEHDLRKMDRIARAQDRFQQRNAVPESQREGAVA